MEQSIEMAALDGPLSSPEGDNPVFHAHAAAPVEIMSTTGPLLEIVIDEPLRINMTYEFNEIRTARVNMIKNNGANVMARIQDSFFMHQNQGFRSDFVQAFINAVKLCCPHPHVHRCSFCLCITIHEMITVLDDGSVKFIPFYQDPQDERFFARVKLNAKHFGIKMKELIIEEEKEKEGEDEPKNLQLPICNDCANVLKRYIRKTKMDQFHAEVLNLPVIRLYNRLFSELCLLRFLTEKYTALCQRMRRERNLGVEYGYEQTRESFRKQLGVCRASIDELQSVADDNTVGHKLFNSIINFMTESCDDLQVIVSRNTIEVEEFLELEKKVMVSPLANSESEVSVAHPEDPPETIPSPALVASATWKWVASLFK
uniref:Beclin-1-like protein n=1 Tax=Panagrellus redivivus TaxID=6233 RepID=A0A7E4VJR7_PANRE